MLLELLNGSISFDEYIRSNNIRIIYKRLPKFKRGFIFQYRNINVIYISSYLSEHSKKETLLHEFAHLELCHVDKAKQYIAFSIYDIEDEADEYVRSLKSVIKDMKSI